LYEKSLVCINWVTLCTPRLITYRNYQDSICKCYLRHCRRPWTRTQKRDGGLTSKPFFKKCFLSKFFFFFSFEVFRTNYIRSFFIPKLFHFYLFLSKLFYTWLFHSKLLYLKLFPFQCHLFEDFFIWSYYIRFHSIWSYFTLFEVIPTLKKKLEKKEDETHFSHRWRLKEKREG